MIKLNETTSVPTESFIKGTDNVDFNFNLSSLHENSSLKNFDVYKTFFQNFKIMLDDEVSLYSFFYKLGRAEMGLKGTLTLP